MADKFKHKPSKNISKQKLVYTEENKIMKLQDRNDTEKYMQKQKYKRVGDIEARMRNLTCVLSEFKKEEMKRMAER